MTRVLVVGAGVAGLLTVQALLDRAAALASAPPDITLLAHRHGHGTASRSGGLSLPYASTDGRVARWTARSTEIVVSGAHRPAVGHTRQARALLVSRRGPVSGPVSGSVSGPVGEEVDPAALGLPGYPYGLRAAPSPQWDTCRLLLTWPDRLEREHGVRVVDLPQRLTSTVDLTALHDRHGADVTVACLGLGAYVLGDTHLHGRLGVLLQGPVPHGTVHAEGAVIDDDDALLPRYTVPHRGNGSDRDSGSGSSGSEGAGSDDHLHAVGPTCPWTTRPTGTTRPA